MKKELFLDSRILNKKGYNIVDTFVYLSTVNKLIISNECRSNEKLTELKASITYFIRHIEKTKNYILSRRILNKFKSGIEYLIKDLKSPCTSAFEISLRSSSNIFDLLQLLSSIIIFVQNHSEYCSDYSKFKEKMNDLIIRINLTYNYSLSPSEFLMFKNIQKSIDSLL